MERHDETQEDYFLIETNPETNRGDIEISAEVGRIEDILANDSVDVCYNIKVVRVCVESIAADRVVLTAYIAGVKIAKATLTPAAACVKIKGKVAGDGAKVEAKICADFAGKKLTIQGKICVLLICTKFKQTILKW